MYIYIQTLELTLVLSYSILLVISCLIRSLRKYNSRETYRSTLQEA